MLLKCHTAIFVMYQREHPLVSTSTTATENIIDIVTPKSARARLQSAIADPRNGSNVHAGYLQQKVHDGKSFFGIMDKYKWRSTYFLLRSGTLQRYADIYGKTSSEQPDQVYDLLGATLQTKPKSHLLILSLRSESGAGKKSTKTLTLRTDYQSGVALWFNHLENHIRNAATMQAAARVRAPRQRRAPPSSAPLPPKILSRPEHPNEEALSVAVDGQGAKASVCGECAEFVVHAPRGYHGGRRLGRLLGGATCVDAG